MLLPRRGPGGWRFGKRYIVSDPSFLGALRHAISPSTAKLVAGEVDKKLTRGTVDQVRAALPDFL